MLGDSMLSQSRPRIQGKTCWLSAVWPAVALWPLPVGSFGVLVVVAIVTEQLIGLSCCCRRRNGNNACSEVLSGFTALLQYVCLWVILTKLWKVSRLFQLGNTTWLCSETQDNNFYIHNFLKRIFYSAFSPLWYKLTGNMRKGVWDATNVWKWTSDSIYK